MLNEYLNSMHGNCLKWGKKAFVDVCAKRCGYVVALIIHTVGIFWWKQNGQMPRGRKAKLPANLAARTIARALLRVAQLQI
jgi:hypothetical protein